MSYEPTGLEVLFLWKLAVAGGGAWKKEIKPDPDTKLRNALKSAGLITEAKEVSPSGGRASLFLRLTESGWDWLSAHVDAPISPTARANPTLQALLSRLKAHLETHQVSLADFLAPPAQPVPVAEPPRSIDIPAEIKRACQRIATAWESERVRLADLRESLPTIPGADLDAALLQMENRGEVILSRFDNPLEVQDRDREAVLRTPSGEERHLVIFLGGQRT